MRGYIGRLLFPNMPRLVREHKVRALYFIIVLVLVLCALLALAFWLAHSLRLT